MRPSIAICAVAIATLAAPEARADAAGSGWTFSLLGGTTLIDEDVEADDDLLVGGRIGYMLGSYIHIEGMFHSMKSAADMALGDELRLDHYGVDLVLNPFPGGVLEPYLAGGYAGTDWRLTGGGNNFNGFEAGGGLRVRLARGDGWRWDLRLDARDVFSKLDSPLVDASVVDDTHQQILLSAGLQLSFRSREKDSDGDGVIDKLDRCAETPAGAMVDAEGCPFDSDGDRVVDGLDRCPGSPRGALVDSRGCPADRDGDGVYDGLDRCDNTPRGVPVDARGCTRDSDGDGVHDGIDRCPRTKQGVEVDAKGCEVTKLERAMLDTGLIRLDSIFFESGKAILKPESYPSLDEVGRILEKWPGLRIEVGGHTDSQGAADMNQRLSGDRAGAVRTYLVQHFATLQLSQLDVMGYGETQPIADNDSKEGRARNRRVEFRVLNRGTLER